MELEVILGQWMAVREDVVVADGRHTRRCWIKRKRMLEMMGKHPKGSLP